MLMVITMDIKYNDRLTGPLTVKQSIYVSIGAIICIYLLFLSGVSFPSSLILCFITLFILSVSLLSDFLARKKKILSVLVFIRRGESTTWLDRLKSICSRYSLNLVLKEYSGIDLNKFSETIPAISKRLKTKLYSLNAEGRTTPQTLIKEGEKLEGIKAGLERGEFQGVYRIGVTAGKELDRFHRESFEREVREIIDSLENTLEGFTIIV